MLMVAESITTYLHAISLGEERSQVLHSPFTLKILNAEDGG